MQRREFLKKSGQAGIAAWTAVSAAQVRGANDRLRIGVIGCGGRGRFDARLMRGTPEDIQAEAAASYRNGNMDPRLKEPRNVEIAAPDSAAPARSRRPCCYAASPGATTR